ncbi:MAG: DUF547 domain-containing protein [Alphaproteobacteria bacterium]|nr:DUF547 domain-containing protein [Alphaproteobacteria bacterium]
MRGFCVPFALLFLLALGAFALSATVAAAPRAELWARWTAHDPAATRSIDHSDWDALLARYNSAAADGSRRFDYAAVAAEDRRRLDVYVERLAAAPVATLGRDQQRAFWINLYNALTVRTVLDRWPVASVREISISPGLFSVGPWGKKLIAVEGESLSLDDIEHRILRPIWKDARVHYALNCAAVGCPDLQPVAFTAANTEMLLERAAGTFVNHPRGARIESGGKLRVSSIYVWFRDDFGDGSDAAVIAHLARYAEADLKARLAGALRIDDHGYDWAINAPLK